MKSSCTEVHMESGSIGKTLLAFTLPVLLAQILQQLYYIADCMIIGHFGGANGLAAAGVAGLVLSVMVNFFIGFSTGVSAITARLFGAWKYPDLKRTISTVIYISIIFGIFLTVFGIWNAERFLIWLNCPGEVLEPAKVYLRICLLGIVPQLIYNTGNAILRSLGNTKSALIYLLCSSGMNVALDGIFVIAFSAGLPGAAWATLISQWLLSLFILWKLSHMDAAYRLSFRQKPLPFNELKNLIHMGLPSGMQAVFMSISSLIIQVSINQFGANAVAGMTVFAKVEGFLYYPAFAYGMALTGFVGQNLGAGRLDRVKAAMNTSLKMALGFTIPASLLLIILSKYILACFTKNPEILAAGQEAILYIFPCYFMYSINQVYIGGLKGLGKTGYPMICSMICYCIFRVAWCQVLLPFFDDMRVIYTCYDASWIIMIVLLAVRYYQVYNCYTRERKVQLENEKYIFSLVGR